MLAGARPERDVVADAKKMRSDMAAHKPPKGPLDAKLLPGGLVDLEFAVHTLQLQNHTGFAPPLRAAIGKLVGQGLLPETMLPAYDLLARLLIVVRLVAPDAQPPAAATQALIARALGLSDWETVVASFDSTRQEVGAVWAAVCGG